MSDISDRLGHQYEKIAASAIKVVSKSLGYDVKDHFKIEGVNVECDYALFKDGNLDTIVLVTHTKAESGSHMKFWRNAQEIIESKVSHPESKIINLIFPSEWKQGMIPLMEYLSGNQIVYSSPHPVEDIAIFGIDNNISTHPYFESEVKNLAEALIHYIENPEPGATFAALKEKETQISYLGDNYIKDGLSKLSFFSISQISDMAANLTSLERLDARLFKLLIEYGIIKQANGIVKRFELDYSVSSILQRNDIRNLFGSIEIVKKQHIKEFEEIYSIVSGDEYISIRQMVEKISNITQKIELEECILTYLLEENKLMPKRRNLTLEYLFIISKYIDRTVSHRTASAYAGLPMAGGFSPLPQFLYGNTALEEKVLLKISEYFSNIIWGKNIDEIELYKKLFSSTVDKIKKHKYLNYYVAAAIVHLKGQGFTIDNEHNPSVRIGNKIADRMRAEGIGINEDIANTSFSFLARKGDIEYIFLMISAYDSTHKHKEYPARWMLSQSNHLKEKLFEISSQMKCIVILDGVWNLLFKDLQQSLNAFRVPGIILVTDSGNFFDKQVSEIIEL